MFVCVCVCVAHIYEIRLSTLFYVLKILILCIYFCARVFKYNIFFIFMTANHVDTGCIVHVQSAALFPFCSSCIPYGEPIDNKKFQ